jgi:hypothetical protein
VRRFAIALAVPAIVLSFALPSSVFAQGRVIEETLLVKDPTVASAGKWKVGGAAEFWYVNGKYNFYDSSGNKVGDGTISFTQPGGNFFAGYGDFTVQGTYRSGKGDLNANIGTLSYTTHTKQTDDELTLRWLIRAWSSRVLTPYVLVGYSETKTVEDRTITAGAFVWTCTGQKTASYTTDYKAPLLGIGGIFPISEKFGVRLDGRYKHYRATQTCSGLTGTGNGGDGTLTGYYNITDSWNLQLGGKYTYLNGGSDISWSSRVGFFGMLGYSHSF